MFPNSREPFAHGSCGSCYLGDIFGHVLLVRVFGASDFDTFEEDLLQRQVELGRYGLRLGSPLTRQRWLCDLRRCDFKVPTDSEHHTAPIHTLGPFSKAAPVLRSVQAYLMALITALGATAIYLSEDRSNIPSFQHAMWFAIITMTSVGYGDYYPESFEGYVSVSVLTFVSVLFLALPCGHHRL